MTIATALPFSLPSLPLRRSPASLPLSLSLSSSSHLSLRFAAPAPAAAAAAASASDLPLGRTIDFDPSPPDQDPLLHSAGPDGGNPFDGSGNGGGGGGGGEEDPHDDDFQEDQPNSNHKMLMSQKFTLLYAALVGVGGIMGYVKSGSMKSAAAGGISSLLLCYVYTQLPTNPTFASSVGLGISGALLTVMGSRFKKSGKIFPAGVVSLVSLFMTGGYLHGILRGH